MDLQLRGQTAVVVGGANGIGRAIAAAFFQEGAAVAILDIDDVSANTALAEMTGGQVDSIFHSVDVASQADFAVAREDLSKRWGRIDHLVYAAGIGSGKLGFPFWNLSPADWSRVLDVNLQGAVRFVHAFREDITDARNSEQCDASVLFLSSIAGQIGSQTDPPYSAAKAALLNFTRCAARDLAAWKTRVNAICPGMVKTELNRSVWRSWQAASPTQNTLDYEGWAAEKIEQVSPLGRWQSAEEIAALAVFLASPHARNITGQALNVDGGQVMH